MTSPHMSPERTWKNVEERGRMLKNIGHGGKGLGRGRRLGEGRERGLRKKDGNVAHGDGD